MAMNKSQTKFVQKMVQARLNELERMKTHSKNMAEDPGFPNYTHDYANRLNVRREKEIKTCRGILDELDPDN